MRGKLISALAYPMVLALVAILVVALLMIAVVPKVVEQFDDVNQQLPFVTRLVIGISDFLANWWGAILAVMFIIGIASWRALKEPKIKYRVDSFVLRLPFLGRLLRDLNAARLARTLSTMVASRLPILEGLRLTTNTIGNSVLRKASEDMVEAIRGGGSLSKALKNTGVFPPMLVYLTASGEASGQLDDMRLPLVVGYYAIGVPFINAYVSAQKAMQMPLKARCGFEVKVAALTAPADKAVKPVTGPLDVFISQNAGEAGFAVGRLDAQTNGTVRLAIDSAKSTALFGWLAMLESRGVSVEELVINPGANETVTATMLLRSAKPD